jgi:two-component system OmpR family sensor kinase
LRADVGNRKDEIGTLGDSFNLMIDKLEHLFKSQKRFAANAAHELLTPLTGLRGSLEVLLRGAQDDRETLRRLTTGMYKEVNHLIRLCDQLLGLSRLENTANISKRSIMLNEFMKDFLNKAKSLTRSHSLVVQEGPFVRFMADPGLLEQMLFNLIANAVHYSATDTTLLIEWTLIPGFVKLCITDQGEGMDEETLEHVFEPFYRGGNRKYSNEKGAGLGLALTKSMIEAHGGSIRIESTPGEGTTVCLTFPL